MKLSEGIFHQGWQIGWWRGARAPPEKFLHQLGKLRKKTAIEGESLNRSNHKNIENVSCTCTARENQKLPPLEL